MLGDADDGDDDDDDDKKRKGLVKAPFESMYASIHSRVGSS